MSIGTPPARKRTRRSPEESRENILAAAEALLVEKGPQALKLADVAAAAGVVHATVLHHFGSIDGVQAALMERMIRQLVDQILAMEAPSDDPMARAEAGATALFDAFESRGAARLAAWLELTGEARRLTTVRAAVDEVVSARMAAAGLDPAVARDFILVSVILAVGVGLFGPSLSELMGQPPGRARELAQAWLKVREAAWLARASSPET
ncbi:TetR/AcrR family transcriptional regulator [Phenylobacterium sp.]|uniref:TetR/AcrR family transcriptional regulator n=1 Tax=Phenylobacterium sp. TaxID=1871053 RepID=UPI0035B10EDC